MYFILSSLFLIAGSTMIFISIIKFIYDLKSVHKKVLQNKTTLINSYYICTFLMIFFLISYIVVLIYLTQILVNITHFFVASIFLIGSIYIYIMVNVQKNMSSALIESNLSIITGIINAVEEKDIYAHGHSENVKNIVDVFYEALPLNYKIVINKSNLLTAAILHDIGKIYIPDSIINKADKLDFEEYELIKDHSTNGEEVLQSIYKNNIPIWVRYHHERVDGNGYYKIPAEDIPLESKIIFIADTFSALYSDRIYRKGYSFEESILILKNLKGTQLDSELVDIFCTIDFEILKSL